MLDNWGEVRKSAAEQNRFVGWYFLIGGLLVFALAVFDLIDWEAAFCVGTIPVLGGVHELWVHRRR